jgi:hypothetical protein
MASVGEAKKLWEPSMGSSRDSFTDDSIFLTFPTQILSIIAVDGPAETNSNNCFALGPRIRGHESLSGLFRGTH